MWSSWKEFWVKSVKLYWQASHLIKADLEQDKVAKDKIDAARTPIMSDVVLGAENEKSE